MAAGSDAGCVGREIPGVAPFGSVAEGVPPFAVLFGSVVD